MPIEDLAASTMSNSLVNSIKEIGYNFTSSVENCKTSLFNFGGKELTVDDVARIITMMVQNHDSLQVDVPLITPGNFWVGQELITNENYAPRNWNVEIFIQTLKEVSPKLNWTEIFVRLDNPEFKILDRESLILLFKILRMGFHSSGFPVTVFPMDCLFRHWKNLDGQISLITQILNNPDVFSLADHPFHLVPIDILKSPPEVENKEVTTWRCIYLVELLLHAADRGFVKVAELFNFPLQRCPDILLLTMLQISPPITLLRQELLTTLITIFLGNHPNSAIVLQYAWHSQNPNIKPIIMHAMADWYIRSGSDHTRLNRILDITLDLKALSLLLNYQSFVFVIHLACMASRREYLKLNKWLTDKIRDHGENFISALVQFMQKCYPPAGKDVTEEHMANVVHLPAETMEILISCLQLCINNVQPDLSEVIAQVLKNFTLNKPQHIQIGIVKPYRIEAEPMRTLTQAPHSVEPISNLIPNFSNMSLVGGSNRRYVSPPLLPIPVPQPRIYQQLPMNNAVVPLQYNTNIPNMQIWSNDRQLACVTKDIEDEANSYFQMIYNSSTMTIEQSLDLLKGFQESTNPRDRQVADCMLKNLFEEYKFFPQYPDKELVVTGLLFGGIIEKNLLVYQNNLGLALKNVLDALRNPIGSKMFNFGVIALDKFKTKLKKFPTYCEHIKSIPHFNEFPKHLIDFVEFGIRKTVPPVQILKNKANNVIPANDFSNFFNPVNENTSFKGNSESTTVTTVTTLSRRGSCPSIANASNIDTLLVATDIKNTIKTPSEDAQDKSAFIFNNLSQVNLDQKCEDLKKIISKDYYEWLAQYLVMKRVSIEHNFHTLYSKFLDALNIPELLDFIVHETYRNIKILLRSDKSIANFSDRSLLKNLGHWLGMMTLARNKPILYIDLDLKSLLLEAYNKGPQELLYIVPFIAKIIESAANSIIFRPPNPWTMAIMNVLAELHQEQDLKLNLKFEIEVLCKKLDVEIDQLKPTVYLKDIEKYKMIDKQLSEQIQKQPIPSHTKEFSQPITLPTVPFLTTPGEIVLNNFPADNSIVTACIPKPRFSFEEVNASTSCVLDSKITIDPNIVLFQTYPQLKQLVKPAIERSVQEWVHPVVERTLRYALPTCEQMIRKDFILDLDENRMRTCALLMMKNLAAGIALVTTKEPLASTIYNHIKSTLNSTVALGSSQQKELIDAAASILSSDNLDLVCAIIQKTAVEHALTEIDKRLLFDFEVRRRARQDCIQHWSPNILKYYTEWLPEKLRLIPGSINEAQLVVYEEFGRNVPGFKPDIIFRENITKDIPSQVTYHPLVQSQMLNPALLFGGDDMMISINSINEFLSTSLSPTSPYLTNIRSLSDCIIVAKKNRNPMSTFTLIKKALENLLERGTYGIDVDIPEKLLLKYKEINMNVLKTIQHTEAYGPVWTATAVTEVLIRCNDELKYNVEVVDTLIRTNLIVMQQYDIALAQNIECGDSTAVTFALQLIHTHLIDNSTQRHAYDIEFNKTIESLNKIGHKGHPSESLKALLESLNMNTDANNNTGDNCIIGPVAYLHRSILEVKTFIEERNTEFMNQCVNIIVEWTEILNTPPVIDLIQHFNVITHKMRIHGILMNEQNFTMFIKIGTEKCIYNFYEMSESAIDIIPKDLSKLCNAFVKLLNMLIINCADISIILSKINMINKVLGIMTGCLLRDHDKYGVSFRSYPYQKLLYHFFLEFDQPYAAMEEINFHTLVALSHALRLAKPSVCPGFCFAWLDIVAQGNFIKRILTVRPHNTGWSLYSTLLIDLFKFMSPFLRNTEVANSIMTLYRGTLKLILVLFHDFPEFLCDYHSLLCDEIPSNCIQLRNIILTAYPRHMKLPDPATPGLKVDLLPEMGLSPRAVVNYSAVLQPAKFKNDLDNYLETRGPVTFLSELRNKVQISKEPGQKYNIRLINAIVFYVGVHAIEQIRAKGQQPCSSNVTNSSHMDILQNFAVDLDYEGRYLFLNALANQLRYPNRHTHYYSCALLYLFAESNCEPLKEQITRMLLERLIVNKPHPWGLMVSFIELMRNPKYQFWDHYFVQCVPEVQIELQKKLHEIGVESPIVQTNKTYPDYSSALQIEPTRLRCTDINGSDDNITSVDFNNETAFYISEVAGEN